MERQTSSEPHLLQQEREPAHTAGDLQTSSSSPAAAKSNEAAGRQAATISSNSSNSSEDEGSSRHRSPPTPASAQCQAKHAFPQQLLATPPSSGTAGDVVGADAGESAPPAAGSGGNPAHSTPCSSPQPAGVGGAETDTTTSDGISS
ncbi:unnamed protein product, partial [Ectocarpus sp. 13 AM-2016]